jgi:hypothetical protein
MNRLNPVTTILILATTFVVVVAGWSLLSYVSHHGKVGVKVIVLPKDSRLTIDGKSTRAGTIYFTKATHTLKASRQSFTTIARTINFATYDKSQIIYMLPGPDSDQARQYLVAHPDIQAQREAAAGNQSSQAQQQLSKNKLISLLPYAGPGGDYTVDFGTTSQADGSQKVTIYIEANTDEAKQEALDWIKSSGNNPDKFTIVYQSLSNTIQADNAGGSEYQ